MRRQLARQNERLQEEIAEREQVQTALRLTQYSVDNGADAVFWLNTEGCIDYVNRAACELLQYAPEELLGRHAYDIEVGNPREQWPAYWQRIKQVRAETVETRMRRCDGSIVPIEASLCYLAFDGSEHVFCFARDIGKRKQAEEALLHTVEQLKESNRKLEDMHQQLLQSEKMASLGQLAAGVAHEINNPIAFVNANLGTLREYLTGLLQLVALYERGENLLVADLALLEDIRGAREKLDLAFLREDASHLLAESLDGVQRVRRIVQDLRDFSHVDQAERQPYKLHAGLDSALNILSSEIRGKVEVRKEYGVLPEVDCVPAQINQVFMGLLMNAVQAVGQGGIVTIRTGTENGSVWVEIEDNGCGIPQENLQHVFEPFFTTKPPGKGTGLGLSMCYGIIKQHGGRIDIESEVGKGTRVTVRLATP
jgi:PAS domain S-box-containing protein